MRAQCSPNVQTGTVIYSEGVRATARVWALKNPTSETRAYSRVKFARPMSAGTQKALLSRVGQGPHSPRLGLDDPARLRYAACV